ncbi:MAG: type VI secretion system-associated protein TagF [Candidatus Eisenbacteria bacterium]|uniref:Type VI secretion system-associated protein TagF n=1 Tax=Eiseniibacteriota bacterium TaxID=2212470 RepID=A0A948RZ23_UNCEI|nr:type VI secretion system-associated protein TagF [Candidatus Eisenbacteria bacterium]MBU1948768.1 type VI secretion system-associated protein TagF [Candidatus Eisenbacteria bacterium]MBU2692204.1 type VI secretion system-associated protein TagF [Candidatus Eisenbacteria bacterium]
MNEKGYEIGCYGKLPVAADFISSQADHPAAAGFVRWLDEAISLARTRLNDDWLEHFQKMPPHGFIYRSNGSSSYLAGALFPSRDQSGRAFPFATFFRSGGSAATLNAAAIPRHLGEFVKAASAIRDGDPSDINDLHRVLNDLGGTIPPMDQMGRGNDWDPLDGWTVGKLAQSLGFGGGIKIVRRVSRNLLDIAPRFQTRPDRTPALGFRFPMPSEAENVLPALTFWLESSRVILGSALPLPIIFWTLAADRSQAHLDLYYMTPPPARFLLLLVPALSSDNLYPLDEDDAPQRMSHNALIAGAMEQAGRSDEPLVSVLRSLDRALGH